MSFRIAVRGLWKSPGFTAVGVLSLAVGVGLNAGVFGVLEALLLRPLPYAEADELYGIQDIRASAQSEFLSFDEYLQIRDGVRSFSGVGAYEAGFAASEALRLKGPSGRVVQGFAVSENLFQVLGVRPLFGRAFAPGEAGRVVVLGYSVWEREFGADPSILGRHVRIDGQPHVVIGVMPKGFWFPILDSGFWTLLAPAGRRRTDAYTLSLIGRLHDAMSPLAARSELELLMERLNIARAEPDLFRRVRLVSLEDARRPSDAPFFFLMQAVVGCVLLITCANIASLLLVRGAARAGTTAIQAALGGRYRDLVSPLLIEILLIVGLATLAGTSLGSTGTKILGAAIVPLPLQGALEPDLNIRVALFLVAVFCLLAAVCCLVPMVQVRRIVPLSVLKGSGSTILGASKFLKRARSGLVSVQLGLSITLLVGTAILTRTLATLDDWDPGFTTAGLFTIDVGETGGSAATSQSLELILERLKGEVPGLTHVAARWRSDFSRLRASRGTTQDSVPCACEFVTPGYLQTLGVPLLEGRHFVESDLSGGAVILDQRAATRLGRPRGLVGSLVWLEADGITRSVPVVGVVQNISLHPPIAEGVRTPPHAYIVGRPEAANSATIVLRAGPDARIVSSVRAVLLDMDPEFPVFELRSLEASLYGYLTPMRAYVAACAALAGLALALAMIGLYGTMSYVAQQRRSELGVRVALGAGPGRIVAIILRDAAGIAAIGGLLGMLGAVAITTVLRALVVEVADGGPLLFAGIVVLLPLIVVAAGLPPALRASRLDPASALRAL